MSDVSIPDADADAPREIDVRHLGNAQVICCFVQDDVIVDPGPEVSVATLLDELGDWQPRAILLTHIHLDHAGATGALVQRWPDVEVWVHGRGAPHIVDPARLMASATQLYGADMDRLWGRMLPVPPENLRVLEGGEQLGPWRVAYTPGHAKHHVSYLYEPTGTAFAGDVAGVRVAKGPTIPPTPPPDIDLEAWAASADVLGAWAPQRLAITHFGAFPDVAAQLAELQEGLAHWGQLARETDGPGFAAAIRAHVRAVDPSAAAAYEQAGPPDTLWPGLARYWQKKG